MTDIAAEREPLGNGVPVRFTPEIANAARRLAELDGMTVSAWIRLQVERELGQREGKCRTCGQELPEAAP